MPKITAFAVLAGLLALSACGRTTEQRAATGALGGAAVGTAIGGPIAGAAVGGTVGALSN